LYEEIVCETQPADPQGAHLLHTIAEQAIIKTPASSQPEPRRSQAQALPRITVRTTKCRFRCQALERAAKPLRALHPLYHRPKYRNAHVVQPKNPHGTTKAPHKGIHAQTQTHTHTHTPHARTS